MVNVHLKCRPITWIKGLIDEFKYGNWKDKERVKLRKRDVGAVQTRTLFGNWVISRVLDVQMISNFYTDLVRHRPTTFMWTPRSKKTVFMSKL